MLDYKLEKLDNGLKIITAPLKSTKAVSVLIMVGTGSRYENAQENGIAHFLEHMFFKGTQKRPKTIDIAKELDSVGAAYNAFTGEEYTGFFIQAESGHFDLALDMLTDMLFNSKFDEKEIEKEKGVILEEINMIKDLPQEYVEYVMKELLWNDQPLGRTITGEAETVIKFNRDTFTSFYKRYYQPENMIVTVSGDPTNQWSEKIKTVFSKLPKNHTADFEKVTGSQDKLKLKIFNKTTDQAHFILGFRALNYSDPKKPILKVLNNIMGATMSSRLFTEVREKRGLCYYISSGITDYIDTGFWGVNAGVDIKRIEEALEVIIDEFNKIKQNKVSNEELKRAKENMRGRMYLGLEESMRVAEFLAEQELLMQKIQDPDEVIADIDRVTKEDVHNLAKEIFNPDKLNFAMVGPFEKTEKFETILKRLK
jgi:predicted Zn-dependent peptidase